MSVGGIESIGAAGFQPYVAPQVSSSGATAGIGAGAGIGADAAGAAGGTDFGGMVLDGLNRLDSVQRTSDNLAVQAATGELANIHDYTIAATEAAVTTQVTVAVRNKAIEAFNEIMRMQV